MSLQSDEELYKILVKDAVHFLESLGNYYGADRAMEVWNKLGEAVGPDVQGQVFMSMLSANTGSGDRIQISRGPSGIQAIPVIKCIRAHTGYGLKHARDAWDVTEHRAVWIECVNRDAAKLAIEELRMLGMRVL